MPKFTIPNEVLDQESGQRNDVFPKGLWQGVIEVVRIREITQGEGGDFFLQDRSGNYFADHCEVASIQIGSNVGLEEGQPNIGEMKYFDENLILSFDGLNWDDYEHEDGDDRWALRQTQLRLTKLALALGLTEGDAESSGPVDHFDELLRTTDGGVDTSLNGMAVSFKVSHRKKQDGTPKAFTAQWYAVG